METVGDRLLPKCGFGFSGWMLMLLPFLLVIACNNQTPPPPLKNPSENATSTPPGRQYQALAESHYHAPDFTADIRIDAPQEQVELNKARMAMAEQQYAKAITLLQQVPAEYENDANYLHAHALFANKNYPQSAVLFNKLAANDRYGEAAQWYGLLAMMPYFERRKTFVMEGLKKIAVNDRHAFQVEAKQLVSEIVY